MRSTPFYLLAAILVLSAGCRKDVTEGGAVRTETADQLYIEVSALGSESYFNDHKLGMKMAGKALGVKTKYVGPATLDMIAMATAFEQAIVQRPAGIVVVGFEPVLNPLVDKAVEAGIPVVTVDADLPGSKRIAFVGTGNVEAGQVGARKLAELLDGKGKVALMTLIGQSNLEDRVAGYRKVLDEYRGIEIVDVVDTGGDPIKATQRAVTLLQKHTDLAGIACVEAISGTAAATAVTSWNSRKA